MYFLVSKIAHHHTCIILSRRHLVNITLIWVETRVTQTCKHSVLVCVAIECFIGNFLHDFTQQQETQVRVGKLGADRVDWLDVSDVVDDLVLGLGQGSRIVVRESCVMKKQVFDGCVTFFIGIVIGDILAD